MWTRESNLDHYASYKKKYSHRRRSRFPTTLEEDLASSVVGNLLLVIVVGRTTYSTAVRTMEVRIVLEGKDCATGCCSCHQDTVMGGTTTVCTTSPVDVVVLLHDEYHRR